MSAKRSKEESLQELIELTKQISILIEDNNQNMKDCFASLKKIQNQICPKKPNPLTRALKKLLNRECV